MAKKVDHTHGDTGEKPADGLNFQSGGKPDSEVFDWFWTEVPAAINDHADELDAIDADDDGTVDAADTATKVKGNDIDSDGDGKVNAADDAQNAKNVEFTYKGNDIDTDGDGTVNAADTAAKVKGNDIDSDGDGIVDTADTANSISNVTFEDLDNFKLIERGEGSVSGGTVFSLYTDYSLSDPKNIVIGFVQTKSNNAGRSVFGATNPDRLNNDEGNIGYHVKATGFGTVEINLVNLASGGKVIVYDFYEVQRGSV